MLMCLFNTDGSYAGFARFDERETLLECRIRSANGESSLGDVRGLALPLLAGVTDEGGDQVLFAQTKRPGQPHFLPAFVARIQASRLFPVALPNERAAVWRKLLEARFPETSYARYASALALWPQEDIGYWETVLSASV